MSQVDMLLVDAANVYARNKHKVGHLSRSDGVASGALYGFIRTVHAAVSRFDPEAVLLCLEQGGSTKRKSMLPEYKADRPHEQMFVADHDMAIVEWAYNSGYSIPKAEHPVEADDMIAWFARHDRTSIILSTDHDFKRCIREGEVWIAKDSKGACYSELDLMEELRCTPEQYLWVCAIAGDSSDNVAGVPGVGAKTAVNILKQHGWNFNVALGTPRLHPYKDVIWRNMDVLQFIDPGHVESQFGQYDSQWLRTFYSGWEFKSLLKKHDEKERQMS